MSASADGTADGPFVEPGAARRLLPFALTGLAATAIMILSDLPHLRGYLLALTAAVALVAAAVVVPWRRLPAAAQDVPVLASFAVIALIRTAGGGGLSGYGAIVLLPVCWIAMYGQRRALWAALVGTGAIFVGPWLLIGGAHYPAAELRRGAILMLVAGLVGLAVQSLVRSLEDQRAAMAAAAEQVAHSAEQLAAVAHVRHTMLVNVDPRKAICDGAMELTGAAISVLLEPTEHALRVTASLGVDLLDSTVPLDPTRSAAVECLLTGRRQYIPDVASDPRVPQPLRSQTKAMSLYYEPVVRRGSIVAVLLVGWSQTRGLDEATRAAMSLMAIEASVALEQAELLRTVHDLARTDQLTGGRNRRAFEELLPALLSERAADAPPVCVALLDLDHFKAYNDTHGHPAGDRLLQRATASWSRQLRGTDVLARYGGEEFVVVLADCVLDDAVMVLEKLRDATPDGETVSIGIAQWDGRETQEALMQRVDKALYSAKAAGRNRLCAA